MLKRIFFITSIFFLPFSTNFVFAQDDFGVDFSVEGEHKLAKGLKLNITGDVRTQDNSRRIERYAVGAGLSYKFWSSADKRWDAKVFGAWEFMWLQKLETINLKSDYRIIDEKEIHAYNEQQRYWRNRHRTSLGASLGFSPNKRWHFGIKETLQYNHYAKKDSVCLTKWRFNDDDELYPNPTNDAKKSKDYLLLRNKLSASYNIPHCKFEPFASVDLGLGLNYDTTKWKYTIGTDYKISKTNKISILYRYTYDDEGDDKKGSMIGLGWSFEF